MTMSGGLADAETERRGHQRHPARGREHVQRPVQFQRLERLRCRAATTPRGSRTRACGPLSSSSRSTTSMPMFGGRIVRDKLWFYGVYRQTGGEEHRAGHVLEQERRRPDAVDRRLRPIQAGLQQQRGAPGDDPVDVAGDAAQQVQRPLVRAVQRRQLRPGRRRRSAASTTPEASAAVLLHPVPSTACHVAVADLGPVAGRGRLGHVSGPVPLRARGTTAPTSRG